jgi:choice-of-anchor C domain-containing protein
VKNMNIKKLLISSATASILFGSLITTAYAASLVTNGGFETGTEPGAFTQVNALGTNITNWTVVSGSVDYIGSYWAASEGTKSIDMSGSEAGSISQDISTVPGQFYTVTFDLSGNPDGGDSLKTLDVTTVGVPMIFTYDTNVIGNTKLDMKWVHKSFIFKAIDPTTTLTFTSENQSAYGPALDNVSVVSTKDLCKNNGWQTYPEHTFKNQGDCVSYFQSNENATGNKSK